MSGMPFEVYIYNTIRRNYPAQDGWIIDEQPTLINGSRPDFIVSRRKSIVVIDAKDKAELAMDDIYQIDRYGQQCKARSAVIYVANDTEIPEDVKSYANELGIRIIRTQWRA